MSKIALVTGVNGQDGSYLAELLLDEKYEVYGLVRRSSNPHTTRISHILDKINIVYGDLLDASSLNVVIKDVQPDEIYSLASQSFVGLSWSQPVNTGMVTGIGVVNLLEAVRQFGMGKERFYQASSSEMFGKVKETPQNENTPFYPRSPYGAAKLYAHWMCINYRESYGMYISNGISFNHESERRGIEFVTKKITDGVAKIKLGKLNELVLGNIDSKRDWGYAKDFVEAYWLMLQQSKPDDYVIATGETHSVQEFVDLAFKEVGLDYRNYLRQDEKYMRPAEVDCLVGDSTKARKVLGWKPKVLFKELVKLMVDFDLRNNDKYDFR